MAAAQQLNYLTKIQLLLSTRLQRNANGNKTHQSSIPNLDGVEISYFRFLFQLKFQSPIKH